MHSGKAMQSCKGVPAEVGVTEVELHLVLNAGVQVRHGAIEGFKQRNTAESREGNGNGKGSKGI